MIPGLSYDAEIDYLRRQVEELKADRETLANEVDELNLKCDSLNDTITAQGIKLKGKDAHIAKLEGEIVKLKKVYEAALATRDLQANDYGYINIHELIDLDNAVYEYEQLLGEKK